MVSILKVTWMSGYFVLNALMYCCATWTLGVHPHQVRFAEVAEPLPPPGEPPPAQAVRSKARKPRMEIAGITRRRRPAFGDLRMVPPGPFFYLLRVPPWLRRSVAS